MAPGSCLFDLLDDGLLQEVIQHATNSWGPVDCTCQRLCTLVRRFCQARIRAEAPVVLQLVRAPPQRAFTNVRRLELYKFSSTRGWKFPRTSSYVESVQEWGVVQDAVAAAVAAWPQLEELVLTFGLTLKAYENAPGCLSGIILALRHAPALRRLDLQIVDTHSLQYVPVLTQLTHLALRSLASSGASIVVPGTAWQAPPCHLLAGMTNLVSLQLHNIQASDADACTLPPHLTRLRMDEVGDHAVRLWEGIAACQQLQELDVLVDWGDDSAHPTLLLQTIAGQLTGLVQLQLSQTGKGYYGVNLNRMLDTMLQQASAADQEEGQGEMWRAVVLPLGPAQGYPDPEEGYPDPEGYIMVPPPNMGALSNLQHISTSRWGDEHQWWLVVSSEHTWRALAGCSSLRSLAELHASVPPPAGVTFPHLTRLEVTTSTSPGDTVTLLGAFPALKQLQLTVVPRSDAADEQPQERSQVQLSQLTTAGITLLVASEQQSAAVQAELMAAYCSTLYGAMPGLKELRLEWPMCAPLLSSRLPGVSALKQLSQLGLRSEEVDPWSRAPNPLERPMDDERTFHCVDAQQLLQLVQGATQLQSLDLGLSLAADSTMRRDQLVLELQQALPALTFVAVRGHSFESMEPATRAALRPGLFVSGC